MADTETTAYTGAQLDAALDTTEQRIYEAAGDNGVDDVLIPMRAMLAVDRAAQYTMAEFSAMLNGAADRMETPDYEDSHTIWTDSVANLVVNTAGHLLAHPDASLGDIIAAGWADLDDGDLDDSDLDEGEELPARGTPEHDALIVATVLGWLS